MTDIADRMAAHKATARRARASIEPELSELAERVTALEHQIAAMQNCDTDR